MSGSWAKPSTVRERSLHSTATSSRAKEAGHLPWARISSHRDKVAWGRRPVKSAPWQRRAPGVAGGEQRALVVRLVVAGALAGERLRLQPAPLGQDGL